MKPSPFTAYLLFIALASYLLDTYAHGLTVRDAKLFQFFFSASFVIACVFAAVSYAADVFIKPSKEIKENNNGK